MIELDKVYRVIKRKGESSHLAFKVLEPDDMFLVQIPIFSPPRIYYISCKNQKNLKQCEISYDCLKKEFNNFELELIEK